MTTDHPDNHQPGPVGGSLRTPATTHAVGPQVIIDGRMPVQVPRPQDPYYRCVGLLKGFTAEGDVHEGTGTLIAVGSGYGILTCAHVVYDDATASPVERIEFIPAKTLGHEPYGVISAEDDAIRVPDTYVGPPTTGTRHDYAVVRVHPDQVPEAVRPLPKMRTVPVGELVQVQVTGYPDVPSPMQNPAMYLSRGDVVNDPTLTGLLRYKASTLPGSSGSGVCRLNLDREPVPDLAHITAVHVDGDREHHRYNWGVYLDDQVIGWVNRQVNG